MLILRLTLIFILAVVGVGCASSGVTSGTASPAAGDETLHDTVIATEQAFARTMADRDFDAFKTFLSEKAIFMSGDTPVRGKKRVAEKWMGYFESAEAPFSWEPERVVVLESAGLAMSSGPVTGSAGSVIGTFTSVWRLEPDGRWRSR